MTTTPTSGAADLLTLIEAYAEARHRQGHSSYNTQTAAALQAVKDALAAGQATAAQQEAAYAALPTSSYAGRVYEEGFLIGTCPLYTADQMRSFADATYMLRASHGQAPAGAGEAAEHYRNAIARACEGWTMPDGLRKHLETALWSPPTPQPTQPQAGAVPLTDEYPALVCDYCGALTPDPWHSSGMLHGKMSKHIHSCDACAARGAAEAQASREQLTRERIQDLLLCGNPTDEEMRLIRIGWDAAHGIKGGQHGDATPQPTQPDPAYSAACNLATALFKKHFAHLPDFASGQAVWSLCDSMAGVILQIDNMVAGLVQPPTTSPQADSVPALDRDRIREIFMAYGFTVKEGQTDLKQYVYDAAEALLRAARDPADSVQEDAARYRCIRDVPYSDDVRSVLVHQQNAVMDRVIDAARKQGANP